MIFCIYGDHNMFNIVHISLSYVHYIKAFVTICVDIVMFCCDILRDVVLYLHLLQIVINVI